MLLLLVYLVFVIICTCVLQYKVRGVVYYCIYGGLRVKELQVLLILKWSRDCLLYTKKETYNYGVFTVKP